MDIPIQDISIIITRTGRQKLPEWAETSYWTGVDWLIKYTVEDFGPFYYNWDTTNSSGKRFLHCIFSIVTVTKGQRLFVFDSQIVQRNSVFNLDAGHFHVAHS